MKDYLGEFAKRRFERDIDSLPELEKRIILHHKERIPISRNTNEDYTIDEPSASVWLIESRLSAVRGFSFRFSG